VVQVLASSRNAPDQQFVPLRYVSTGVSGMDGAAMNYCVTTQDRRFLRAMKIECDDEDMAEVAAVADIEDKTDAALEKLRDDLAKSQMLNGLLFAILMGYACFLLGLSR
jgi:hypothetical protein